MKNPKTREKCNIKRMIITYKRPMNLGNLLSHRDLATGPPGGLCVCLVCVCVLSVCVLSVCV